jgi:hypothetical protein
MKKRDEAELAGEFMPGFMSRTWAWGFFGLGRTGRGSY